MRSQNALWWRSGTGSLASDRDQKGLRGSTSGCHHKTYSDGIEVVAPCREQKGVENRFSRDAIDHNDQCCTVVKMEGAGLWFIHDPTR